MRDLLYKDLQARTYKPFLQPTPVASSAELELLEVACCQHSVQLNKIRVPAQASRNATAAPLMRRVSESCPPRPEMHL